MLCGVGVLVDLDGGGGGSEGEFEDGGSEGRDGSVVVKVCITA